MKIEIDSGIDISQCVQERTLERCIHEYTTNFTFQAPYRDVGIMYTTHSKTFRGSCLYKGILMQVLFLLPITLNRPKTSAYLFIIYSLYCLIL